MTLVLSLSSTATNLDAQEGDIPTDIVSLILLHQQLQQNYEDLQLKVG